MSYTSCIAKARQNPQRVQAVQLCQQTFGAKSDEAIAGSSSPCGWLTLRDGKLSSHPMADWQQV